MILRTIQKNINQYLNSETKKVLFIWGPRRSGKTTLLEQIKEKTGAPLFNFDYITDQELFKAEETTLKKIAHQHNLILIDEVQNYPASTVAIKILHDLFKIKIIATGSSELRQKSDSFDSLAGRYEELFCLPLSSKEIHNFYTIPDYKSTQYYDEIATHSQMYGNYPEILLEKKEEKKIDLLENILNVFILKDVIHIYNLKNTKLAYDLLTKIALQIGAEVSIRELASTLQTNATTIENYIEIFIKNYILFPLSGFKKNMRNAVGQHRKFYFYDLGIRNMLVKDFRPLHLRPDKGGVFENFIVNEVYKKKMAEKKHLSLYFYREYSGKEIDLVLEDYKRTYTCFEIKSHKHAKINDIFPLEHKLHIIHPDNYYDIIDKI